MTAHRRAWTLRAGLVTALVAGALGGLATPALADATVGVSVLALTPFTPGESQVLQIQVQNKKTEGTDETIKVSVTAPDSNFTISNPQGCTPTSPTSCTILFPGGLAGSKQVMFSIKASANPNIPPGQPSTKSGSVTAQDFTGNSDTAQYQTTLQGAAMQTTQAPTAVPQVSGTVKDIGTGQPLNQAVVAILDAANHTCQTGTNSTGTFSFTKCGGAAIAPGTIAIVVKKDGYQDRNSTATGVAGQNLTVAIVMTANATASTSTDPSADAGLMPSAAGSGINSIPVQAAGNTTGGGGGGAPILIIVLGLVLVLAGVGVIVLIFWRRRENNKGDDSGDGAPARGPAPDGRGGYRGAPADATAVVRSGGYDGGGRRDPMAEAPTMLHSRPIVDEYPDPYGAPMPGPGGPGYGPGGDPAYGQAQDPYATEAGYGGGAGGGYGNDRYAEPTGVYNPPSQRPPADPYAAREYAGGYGADERTAYDDGAGYGGQTRGYGNGAPGGSAPGGSAPGGSEYGGGAGYGADGYGAATAPGGGGGYQPEPTRRYDDGYGAPAGYDQPTTRAGGYGGGEAYGPGGYDAPTAPGGGGGYRASGYDQAAPPAPGGYGGGEAYGSGGYGAPTSGGGFGNGGRPTSGAGYAEPGYEPRGGYQPRGGYPGPATGGGYDEGEYGQGRQAPSRHGSPPEPRRPLDWLDD